MIKPECERGVDFTLGNNRFQAEDLTKTGFKHFEAGDCEVSRIRRAHNEPGFAYVRGGAKTPPHQDVTRTISMGGGDGKVFGLLGFAVHEQGKNVSPKRRSAGLVFEHGDVDFQLARKKC